VCNQVVPSVENVAWAGIAQCDASGFCNGEPGFAAVAVEPRSAR
jgi:hypothetical protein